jgi:carbon storage regulator CsrA
MVDKADREEAGGLVFMRRTGEKVCIGEGISVTVSKIRGGQVFLKFNAPKDVKIHREETLEKIKAKEKEK